MSDLTNEEMKIMNDMAFRVARISNRHRGSDDVIAHLDDVVNAFSQEGALVMGANPSKLLLSEFAQFFLKESNSLLMKGLSVLQNTNDAEVAMVFFATLGNFVVDISGVFRIMMMDEDKDKDNDKVIHM